MKWVAITTVGDEGAAQVAKETLAELGIEVELRRQAISPYFGSPTANVYEIRVLEERVIEAEKALARLALEVEEALIAAAGASQPHEDAVAPPPERNRLSTPAIFMMAIIAIAVLMYLYLESNRAVQP